jgi:hypothetical protein
VVYAECEVRKASFARGRDGGGMGVHVWCGRGRVVLERAVLVRWTVLGRPLVARFIHLA